MVKKLPYEARILFDDTETKPSTSTDYDALITHTVNFPSGNILRQVLPIYFDSMFSKTRYERSLSSLLRKNEVLIRVKSSITFSEKRGLNELTVVASPFFTIYDKEERSIHAYYK